MRVLFTSLRMTSHFLPLVPFIGACRRRGHEVAVAGAEDLRERVAATGATFFQTAHPGEAGLAPIWARLAKLPPAEQRPVVVGEIFAGISAKTALPGMIDAMETWRPSIVVRESTEFAGVVAAEKVGIPHVRIGITARAAELEILGEAAGSVDAHGIGVGLPPDPSAKRILDERVLTLFPAILETPGTDSGLVSRYRAARAEPRPLPDWWPGREGPFVYVTLGTAMGNMDQSRALFRVVLDALVDLPIRVLLTIGANLALELLGEVPPNVHVERFVPQDEVLPHAAAILHHGGSGTTLGALAAGIPMVVVPMFADQPFNAERVAATGAGLALPTRGATPGDIRRSLGRVLEEPAFRQAARKCAQQIAELSPVDDAGIELERLARPG